MNLYEYLFELKKKNLMQNNQKLILKIKQSL